MPFRGALSFLTLCGFFVVCLTATTAKPPKPKSGPYTSILVSGVKKCNKPSLPYVKDPALVISTESNNTKNKSLLKGNVTVFKDTTNIRANIKEYYYEDGKWQMTLYVKNLSCRSQLIAVLLEAFDVMYDKKTCNVPKGVYNFEVNFNSLAHQWMSTREYGRMLRRLEIVTKTGTVVCLEVEEMVKPEIH